MKTPYEWVSRLLVVGAAALLATPAGCGGGGLVGGDCAQGFVYCDGACVNVSSDARNCGSCGVICGPERTCREGACTAGTGGGATMGGGAGTAGAPGGGGAPIGGEGGLGGASSGGGGSGGAASGGGGSGGAASGGTGSGGDGTGGACLAPFDQPAACGNCSTTCADPTPVCAPAGSSFACVSNCNVDPFTTSCSGACVDTETDALHCGGCNQFCPSGICVAGSCIGSTPGHMIAVCMNYEQFHPAAAQTVLLGNSVFLTDQEPARILAYSAYSPGNLRSTTKAAIGAAATARGRTYELTEEVDSTVVKTQLSRSNYDVLVVFDQQTAPPGALQSVGSDWFDAAQTFAEDGGIVVILASDQGTAEMAQLVAALGILDVTGLTNREAQRFYVRAPGDALAINVVSPFLGIQRSCTFQTSQGSTGDRVFVVTDTSPSIGVGAPAVIHRVVQP